MNARKYRVNLDISPLDFPAIIGVGESLVNFRTEPPHIMNNRVVLAITKTFIIVDKSTSMDNDKENEVLSVQCVYQIPPNEIKTREDVYECYKDTTLSLNEAYQYVKETQLPALPKVLLPTPPIDTYQQEIDGVFYLLNSRN